MELSLDAIRLDGGTQSRTELSQDKINEYAHLMLESTVFPDVIVFYDGIAYWLADGFHRYRATEQINRYLIDADVRQGTRRDAVLYSMEANTRHGIPLPLADRKRCAKALLEDEEWRAWSDREIARRCGLSHVTIGSMREELYGKNDHLPVNQPVEPIEPVEDVRKFRTTNEDKRKTVEQFFVDYPMSEQLSNREIAKRCGVDEGTVRNYKKELIDEQEKQRQSEIVEDVKEEELPTTSPAIQDVEEEIQQENLTSTQFFDAIVPGFTEWQQEQEESEAPVTTTTTGYGISELYSRSQGSVEELPQTWNAVNGEQFTAPLPDGKPVMVPNEWKLPREMRKGTEAIEDAWKVMKREQQREIIEQLRNKGADLPTGKYSCIVIDPPWTMKKIERDVRPNQVEFDYPTMTEDELRAFPLPDMAGENCHLYLWTTQKHLPMALRLAEHWGFTYQCLMTWVKNVGMTPFSWMYSTEHILFCTKGNLPLLKIGKRLDFTTKIREHSRKPDEFYDIVKEVSPGPRIDVFSREKRDGFDQYGNEVDKYASA